MAHFIITNVKKMKIKAIKNLKEKVLDTLRKYPQARDSDIWLTLKIWSLYCPNSIKRFPALVEFRESLKDSPELLVKFDTAVGQDGLFETRLSETNEPVFKPMSMVKLTDVLFLPREDNIKRIRAKIQNEEHRYLPTTPEIRAKRKISESEWRAWSQNQDKLFS